MLTPTFHRPWLDGLETVDPLVAGLIEREAARQDDQIELVASENYTWIAALTALSSPGANKLADGYPGRRETGGCELIDEIEQLAVDRAKRLFGAEHANVQPHSGVQANMAVYFACLEPGDTILAMRPDQGGHASHGLAENFSGRLYDVVGYGVDRDSARIDFDEVARLAREHRPRLIVCGASSYPRRIDFARFRAIADDVGALLLCDIAHIAGLIAAGLHESPSPYADFVTSTVHKTLAGPRCGGFILCPERHADAVDHALFPETQAAPLPHLIAAKAVCFGLAETPAFRAYQEQVRRNADALVEALEARGAAVVTGGTDTHLLLVDLRPWRRGGREAAARLANANVSVNAYPVPHETPGAIGGIRLGTPAVTMRGFDADDIQEVGVIVTRVLRDGHDPQELRERSLELCREHPIYPDHRWLG
jgi:glycine hydroxymethyltransferase